MGPTVGLLAGLVTTTYFIIGAITVPLLFGLFFRDLLAWVRVPVPDMAAVATGVILHSALVGWICLEGAEVSVRTTIRLMLVEIGVVLALSTTILMVKVGQPGAVASRHLRPGSPRRLARHVRATARDEPRATHRNRFRHARMPAARPRQPDVVAERPGQLRLVDERNGVLRGAHLREGQHRQLLHFGRLLPDRFDTLRNLVIPIVGVALNLYLIYTAFFSAYGRRRSGRAVALSSPA